MRIHRFYTTTAITEKTFDITDKDIVHQWRSVFRYNTGSQVIMFNGSGVDYLCMISSLRSSGATLTVMKETVIDNTTRKNICLCMALVKKDNFEWVLQKATELGVTTLIPVICERSEKRKLNLDRLQKIVIEASEQSGRGDLMKVRPITTIEEILKDGTLPQEKIVFHPSGIPFRQYISNTNQVSFAAFIGPEGGFSEKELKLFNSYNMSVVTLGSQILRAETAAIAASSLLIF